MNRETVSTPAEPIGLRDRQVMERAFGRLDPIALGGAVGCVAGMGLALATPDHELPC